MPEVLFIGGPMHGQIHQAHPGQTTYIVEVPVKQEIPVYSGAAPWDLPPLTAKTEKVYYELNHEYDDFVFTPRGMPDSEVQEWHAKWRDEAVVTDFLRGVVGAQLPKP